MSLTELRHWHNPVLKTQQPPPTDAANAAAAAAECDDPRILQTELLAAAATANALAP